MEDFDIRLTANIGTIDKLLASFEYPKLMYQKDPEPEDEKEHEGEPTRGEEAVEEDHKQHVKKSLNVSVVSMKISMLDRPELQYENDELIMHDVDLLFDYKLRISYTLFGKTMHFSIKDDDKIKANLSFASYLEDNKYFVLPELDLLKLVVPILGNSIQLDILEYIAPKLKPIEVVDLEKLAFSIPHINTNTTVKNTHFLIDGREISLMVEFDYSKAPPQ